MEKRNLCRLLISVIGALGLISIVVGILAFPEIQAPKVLSKKGLEDYLHTNKVPLQYKNAIINHLAQSGNAQFRFAAAHLREASDETLQRWIDEFRSTSPEPWKRLWDPVVEKMVTFTNERVEAVHQDLKGSAFYRTKEDNKSWRMKDLLDNVSFLFFMTFVSYGIIFAVITFLGLLSVGCNNRCLLLFYLTLTIIVSMVLLVIGIILVMDLQSVVRMNQGLSDKYDSLLRDLKAKQTPYGFTIGDYDVETLADFEGASFSNFEQMLHWIVTLLTGQARFLGYFWVSLSASQLVAALFGFVMMCTAKRSSQRSCCYRIRRNKELPVPATAEAGATKETEPLMQPYVIYA